MSFEHGISVANTKELEPQGINLRECARLISEAFNYMIFENGFVHSDPHPGNIFVRKIDSESWYKGPELKVILLDHGIYTQLTDQVRMDYTKLWRGILSQNEQMIQEAGVALGAKDKELFTAVITQKKYEQVMDEDKTYNT